MAGRTSNLHRSPKGVVPPQLAPHHQGELLKARIAKAKATWRAKAERKQERVASLHNATVLEAKLRRMEDPAAFKVPGTVVLDQIRQTALTAIGLADIRAREAGHAHGLADLMANDLMRNPTSTLVAWAKFLPAAASNTSDNTGSQHLDAVRALTQATNAASRVAGIAADIAERKASLISGDAADIREIHREAEGDSGLIDCEIRNGLKNISLFSEVENGAVSAEGPGAEAPREPALEAESRLEDSANLATTGPLPDNT